MTRVFVFAALALVAGCSGGGSSGGTAAPAAPPSAIAGMVGEAGPVRVGGRYYTRTNLRIVKGEWITNESWLSGDFIPMGTAVAVTDTAKGDTRWQIKMDDGRLYWIQVGRGDAQQEIQKFLSPSDPKAGFDMGTGDVAAGIQYARPEKGMTKAQVIAAIGFPPNVADPATSPQWRYPQLNQGWRARGWARIGSQHNVLVEFEGDTVARIAGYEAE